MSNKPKILTPKIVIFSLSLATILSTVGLILCCSSKQNERAQEPMCEVGSMTMAMDWHAVDPTSIQWREEAPQFDFAIEVQPRIPEPQALGRLQVCRCLLATILVTIQESIQESVEIIGYKPLPSGAYFPIDYPEIEQENGILSARMDETVTLITFNADEQLEPASIQSIDGGLLCIVDDMEGQDENLPFWRRVFQGKKRD